MANLGGEAGHTGKKPKVEGSVPSVRTRYMNRNCLVKTKRRVCIVYGDDAHERSVVECREQKRRRENGWTADRSEMKWSQVTDGVCCSLLRLRFSLHCG